MKKTILVILVILNLMVLMGQLWPAGAPPFANVVNIITLVSNVILLISLVANKKS